MIFQNIDDFVEYVPTAQGSDFALLIPYIKIAEMSVKNELLGDALFEKIIECSCKNTARQQLTFIIAYRAYYEAIPNLDLIQTNNGFGVVSNSNIAPASRERVDKLMQNVINIANKHTDFLIEEIYKDSELVALFADAPYFNEQTFFLTGKDFANSCLLVNKNTARADFLNYFSAVKTLQNGMLTQLIGEELLQDLLQRIRTNTTEQHHKAVIAACKMLIGIGVELEENPNERTRLQTKQNITDALLTYLDDNIHLFPLYEASKPYKARIESRYENTQNDSCYFSI